MPQPRSWTPLPCDDARASWSSPLAPSSAARTRGKAPDKASAPASDAGLAQAADAPESSTLTALTEKFQALLLCSPDGALDLNSAAVSLGVAKRRLYDVTSVMEGIGLLAKKGKSSVVWT